jgi:hypothetical protein
MPVYHFDGLHLLPGLSTKRTRIHGQRTANRPGYPRKKFCRAQLTADAKPRQDGARDARTCRHPAIAEILYVAKRVLYRDHNAANTAIAHQKITAQPDPMQRGFRRQLAQKIEQLGTIGRTKPCIGNATCPP